jgi:hypothetical protein
MNVVLNSRLLVGSYHERALQIARRRLPGPNTRFEWMNSPSSFCVLAIEEEDEVKHETHRATRKVVSSLEAEMRQDLGLRLEA